MRLVQIRNREPGQKTVCVIRYGAWGDAVLISPVLKLLKADGYHVTLNGTERAADVLQNDPNVDAFLLQETNEVPFDKLPEFWKKLAPHFIRVINLSGSIESSLLKSPADPGYDAPKEQRHAECNVNYMDRTLEIAGYPDKKGLLPELYFTPAEERFARRFKKKHKGFFVVVSMSGSSIHKIYPWMGDVVAAITSGIKDSYVCLVGEKGCSGIIDTSSLIRDLCGRLGIRKTFCLLKYADLVISTETSVANAASAFDTPKVILLSHSSEENLTKYWKNCRAVYQPVSCYPCHKLHYTRSTCRLEEDTKLPICAALLSPKKVLDAVQEFYDRYQAAKIANPHA